MPNEEFSSYQSITLDGRVVAGEEPPRNWAVFYYESYYEGLGPTNRMAHIDFNPIYTASDVKRAIEIAKKSEKCKPSMLRLAERTLREGRSTNFGELFFVSRDAQKV